MNSRALRADLLLFVTAAIWGFAFVAQRVGMDHVGPLTFNAVRFALGAAALIPLIRVMERQRDAAKVATPVAVPEEAPAISPASTSFLIKGGLILGAALFLGSTFQQLGLAAPLLESFGFAPSTAGKAGFITGLYVVFVPLMGLAMGQRAGLGSWIGCVLAVIGMYLLSFSGSFSIDFGDALVLVSAVFWAIHVLIIGKMCPGMDGVDAVKLSSVQFAVCAILSLVGALLTEEITMVGLSGAALPILYGGLMSVGVAYTLQVVAQRDANSAHAAIILSLESVFAAIGGFLMLGELLSIRAMIGCGLMLVGMIISQLRP
ncbi:DMT family transporter [Desulfovibrio oxyclinae]|uniref:DMT family transporter n=1 Tax=Desulfovibrio oxyclinae TaxID=63560 RepID=UPI0003682EE4|nr:DMT family transporter [Desulfovibrio oxyclinae]